MEEREDGTVALGGNIELSGFGGFDGGQMVIVKKIVGSYARRFSERCVNFEKLHITVKPLHEKEKSELYEISAYVADGGKKVHGTETGRNLFFAIDAALKRIETQIETEKEKASRP